MSTVWQVGGGMSGSPYDELLIKCDLALLGTGESFQLKDNMLEFSSQENSAEASYDELRPSPTSFTHEKIAGAEDGRMFKDGYDPIK